MTGTEKLYHGDPYLREFEAEVLGIDGNEVELDRTAFYPEGGGQVGDTGSIGGIRVVDTRIRNDRIVHVLEAPPRFDVGETVGCRIDWERRYRIMRLHSASHVMEYFLFRRLGELRRLGSRVDDRKDSSNYAYEGRLPQTAQGGRGGGEPLPS